MNAQPDALDDAELLAAVEDTEALLLHLNYHELESTPGRYPDLSEEEIDGRLRPLLRALAARISRPRATSAQIKEMLDRLVVQAAGGDQMFDPSLESANGDASPVQMRGSARLLLRGADRLADEVERLIDSGRLDARSPAADALLDYNYEANDGHRDRLGVSPRTTRFR